MLGQLKKYCEVVSCIATYCQNISSSHPLVSSKEFSMKRLFFVLWRMSKADLRLLWFALKHPHRPSWLIPASIGLALYAFAPFNLVIPVLGIVDDMVLVPLILHYLLQLLPQHVRQSFSQNAAIHP